MNFTDWFIRIAIMIAQVFPSSQAAHSLNFFLFYAFSAQQNQPTSLQRINYDSHIDPEMIDWLTFTFKDTHIFDIRALYSHDDYV